MTITPDLRDKAKRCLEELRRLWGDRRDEYPLTRDLFAVLEAVTTEEGPVPQVTYPDEGE